MNQTGSHEFVTQRLEIAARLRAIIEAFQIEGGDPEAAGHVPSIPLHRGDLYDTSKEGELHPAVAGRPGLGVLSLM
jgi:hypothetical protein